MTESQQAYRAYLQSDHWRQLRLEAFKKWGRKCYKCPCTFGLDVHHLVYRHPWTEGTVDDVRPCCRSCHEKEHQIIPQKEKKYAQKKRRNSWRREQRRIEKMLARQKAGKKIRGGFLLKKHRKRMEYERKIAKISKQEFYHQNKPRPHWVSRGNSSN